MKYLKKFNLRSDYNDYVASDFIKPNVSFIVEDKDVEYNPNEDNGIRSFTFYNKEFNFEEGMTWEEFINSPYNPNDTTRIKVDSINRIVGALGKGVIGPNGQVVLTEKIIADYAYKSGIIAM